MGWQLHVLYGEIEQRTREIAGQHGGWPCAAGCDWCCRRLAAIPRLTSLEWEWLRAGLDALPEDVQARVRERIDALDGALRPVVCPFLDEPSGMCLVYEHRPAACRTYGFYVERGEGLYCGVIEAMVESGECAEVIWGNQCGVDARVRHFGGEAKDLLTWSLSRTAEP